MDIQASLFDEMQTETTMATSQNINIVNASFNGASASNWKSLFSGFDELYAITFSSGVEFVNRVLEEFAYAEVIFGCEDVLHSDIATIISAQITSIQQLVKTNAARSMAERLATESLRMYVSRDTRSHEKIFILKASDGRKRVITGSANMSASAFCGIQRENITCFDDDWAYEYYYSLYEDFREKCSDKVSYKAIMGSIQDKEFLQDNVDEIPIAQTVKEKKLLILEEAQTDEIEQVDIVANIKGLEHEIKPLLKKEKKDQNKIIVTGDTITGFKRKYKEQRTVEKERKRQLPKLHLDYERNSMDFNGTVLNMNPNGEAVSSDVRCILGYLSSLNCFYGDVKQSQKDYFAFLNWYFASPFMPYLRFVAKKNSYDVTPFPVVGIIYGDSNGGKSTFVRLLTKLMCGHKVPLNSSGDFTSTRIEELKRACEGLPINIDDLAKIQFTNHSEKVIKDDEWGISEGYINYPAIAITTNKLASLPQDITKRTVTCHIDARIDKEAGAKNSRRINESMKLASTALFCEYAKRMFVAIADMEEKMKTAEEDYFPDIFSVSSNILVDIFSGAMQEIPEYISALSYSDYFGDKAIGRNAMQKIMTAWKNEPKQFKVDKKNNKLVYSYPDQGRLYELTYIQQELPPALNAQLTAKSIVMDLDVAKEIFGIAFRKRVFS